MFTIDLLKGVGVPIKTKPGGTLIIVISFIVPVTLAAFIFGTIMSNSILISTNKRSYVHFQKKIDEMLPNLDIQNLSQKRINHLIEGHREIADVIHWHVQWTGVLDALVNNMPPSMILDELDARTFPGDQKQVQSRKDPLKKTQIIEPETALKIKVHTEMVENYSGIPLKFITALRETSLPDLKFEDLHEESSGTDPSNNIATSEIACIIKKE